jgi:psiF repeat
LLNPLPSVTCAARLLAIALLLAATGAAAAELTPAQQRMKACNTQAKAQQLEGARRNRFMTACLNGDGRARTPTPRQRLHDECNQRARGLAGAERRGFMTQCEKGEAALEATSEREQEKDCARRADGRRLAGDDRREYMKGCLEGAAEASR